MAHARRALFVNYRKLALMVLASVLVYNEFVAYYSAYSAWPVRQDGPNWRGVLLVADPQLQGYRGEPAFPLGAVTRWDSDRFLRKTFAWARSYYRLDAVIFLGDLIDEGSTANDADFADYVARFYSIYPADSSSTLIFTSGDNDIGGEGVEAVSEERMRRFRASFPERAVTRVEAIPQLEVVTVNVLAMQVKNSTEDPFKGIPPKKGMRFIVSHIPLSPPSQSPFAAGIINVLKPDVIFSAHYHRGVHVVSGDAAGEITNKATFFRHSMEEPVVVNFTRERDFKTVHEIIVPTCSYRMGEREMAFGLASIDLGGGDPDDPASSPARMVYQNLWLPKRFPMIFLYASAAAVAALLFCVGGCCGRRQQAAAAARRPGSRRASGSGEFHKQI